MISLFLFILTIASFLFYGVVGPDKTWLLAPVFVLIHGLIAVALLRKSLQLSAVSRKPNGSQQTSNFQLPSASILWILFLIWGAALIPSAAVPFESKLVLLFVGAAVGAYLVWGSEMTGFKDNRGVLGGLIFVVMLTALYGLVIHFKNPQSVLWAERYTEHYTGRLMSTYICPNHFAHLMQMMLPFCLALLFIPQAGIYLKIMSAYSFVVFLPPLFLTESRAGWLGSIAGVGVAVCLMALRRSKKLFLSLVILVPLCSTLLLFAGWRYSETFQRRMAPVVEFLEGQAEEGVGSESPDFRPQTWMDTIDMIKDAPLLGHGPGNYRFTFPEYRKRFTGNRIVTGHPHNEYLELIADYGLVGFGLFAAAWLYGLIWVLIHSLKAEETRHAYIGFALLGAAAGTMVHSFFDFQMHVFPNAMVFALLAAVAVGPLRRGSAKKAAPSGKLRSAPYWLLAVGSVALALFCVQVMSSAFLRALGVKAAEGRLAERAAGYYQSALAIDSSNWRAARGMGTLKHFDRRHSVDKSEKVALAMEERRWYETARGLNPKDPEILSSLGRCLIFLGKADAAPDSELIDAGLELMREACGHRNYNDEYWWALGVETRKTGRYAEALEVFRRMETIKRTASSRKNIQWLERALAKPAGQDAESAPPPNLDSEASLNALNQLDDASGASKSLDDLFQKMESRE